MPTNSTAKKTKPKKSTTTKVRPAPEPDDKYAASSWGAVETGGVTDLEVPSGQLCLVKRPGVEGLLREGVLRDMDSFTSLVQAKHINRVQKGKSSKAEQQPDETQAQIAELFSDPDKFANILHVVDRVICHVVVKPAINMTPNDPTRRDPSAIYADMVDMADKMFIFNFVVGGSRDIERFLGESDSAVGDLDAGEDLGSPTE